MSYNITSNAQTSLLQPVTQIMEPVELEEYEHFQVSAHTDIGNRKTQEDRFIIVPKLGDEKYKMSFFGVFDGTVGDFSSETIQKIIIKHLTESKEWDKLISELENQGDVRNAAVEAVFKMYKSADQELLELCSKYCHDYASSTSVTVLLVDKYMVVGHLGDSRVAVQMEENRGLISRFLTVDHKPNNPEEKMRIISSGGSVEFLCSHSNNPFIRGGDFTARKAKGDQPMQLQYSRAFGGKDLKKYGLSSDPDITVLEITEKVKAIVIASDGLWDIKTAEEAFQNLFEGKKLEINPTKYLIDSALMQQRSKSKNADNITAIAVFFKHLKEEENTNSQ